MPLNRKTRRDRPGVGARRLTRLVDHEPTPVVEAKDPIQEHPAPKPDQAADKRGKKSSSYDLIEALAARSNVTVEDVAAVIKSMPSVLREILEESEAVVLNGVGMFTVQKREPRSGHYVPRLGTRIDIEGGRSLRFRARSGFFS